LFRPFACSKSKPKFIQLAADKVPYHANIAQIK